MSKVVNRIGEKNLNNQGYLMEIISYKSAREMQVIFPDGSIINKVAYKEFKNGSIKNINYPSIFKVGFIGKGNYTPFKDKVHYRIWADMLCRCYCLSQKDKYLTYKDVTVCEEWHNFQNFAAWFEQNYIKGFHLDKDILCPHCKIYSPETCAFVPVEINSLFTKREKCRGDLPIGVHRHNLVFRVGVSGVKIRKSLYKTPEDAFLRYKLEKEQHIKEIAEKWKDKIDPRVYQALINYEIKITD